MMERNAPRWQGASEDQSKPPQYAVVVRAWLVAGFLFGANLRHDNRLGSGENCDLSDFLGSAKLKALGSGRMPGGQTTVPGVEPARSKALSPGINVGSGLKRLKHA
jgi:hypothetical protein